MRGVLPTASSAVSSIRLGVNSMVVVVVVVVVVKNNDGHSVTTVMIVH
jgi:hypothetical protein